MTHRDLNIILGPPGTGKTSRMVGLPPGMTGVTGVVEQELAAGTPPDRIGYFAFTKKAAREAVERATAKFSMDAADLPYFRTIHSLCFKRLGLKPDQIMQWRQYRELGDLMGLDLKPARTDLDNWYGMDDGDRMLFLEGLARVKGCSLAKVWEDADEPDISFPQLDQLARSLVTYKASRGLMDYTDMLYEFVKRAHVSAPTLDAVIVDEAQDLSVVQWRAVEAIVAKAQRVYVAGDDDQAIYRWAGADVESFMALRGKTTVLGQSHRIPAAVHQMAERIVRQMTSRTAKQWAPRTERGAVHWYMDPEEIDMGPGTGTWLMLARNGYMLTELENLCKRRGVPYESVGKDNPLSSPALQAILAYSNLLRGKEIDRKAVDLVFRYIGPRTLGQGVRGQLRKAGDHPLTMSQLVEWGFPADPPIWHQMLDKVPEDDREFYIAARKRGEPLNKTPRVRISTIHTAKGGEADNVLLLTDMSARTFREMDRRLDDELRVWYVAVTRTRKALHLVQPRTGNCFEL